MSAVLLEPLIPCMPSSFLSFFSDPEFKQVLKSSVIALVKEDDEFREEIKGTVKWYRMTRKDSDSISGRINLKDKFAAIMDLPEKEDLVAEYDTEKRILTIREM